MKSNSRFHLKALSSGIAAILLSSTIEAGIPINIEKEISTAGLWAPPSQITFYLYDSMESTSPVASQTFDASQWLKASDFAAGKSVRVSAKFTNTDDLDTSGQLWVDTAVDDVLVGMRQALGAEAPLPRDISVETYIESRAGGFIFPDDTVQTTAGITAETDPNLAAHAANASAHHTAYNDAAAVAAIKAADGSGSGLDADLLDGQHGSAFAPAVHNHNADYVNVTGDTMTGKLTVNSSEAADFHGDIALFETDGTRTVDIDADGGLIRLYNGDGEQQVYLSGDSSTGGLLRLYNEANIRTVYLDADGSDAAALFSLYDSAGTETIRMDAQETAGDGAEITMYNTGGTRTLQIDSDSGTQGGYIRLYDSAGTATITLDAQETAGDGAEITMYNAGGTRTLQIDSDSGTQGGYIQLYDSAGNATITLDGETGGDGRITTQELAITGGSDLSEQFDINASMTPVEAGMLVSIDPQNPGKLIPSSTPYDRKVAGVVSGAGGIKTGMMMGQNGSIANGEYPVALTGRVYALVDTREGGKIMPGDLLTTSSVPGYAMKATDAKKRSGAIIGKAMTGLKDEKGLVLVLVSLQ